MLGLFFLSLMLLLAAGCAGITEKTSETMTSAAQEGDRIYTLNEKQTGLQYWYYEPQEASGQALVEELIGAMGKEAPEGQTPLLAPDLNLASWSMRNGIVYLHFDETYAALDSAREILTRAGIVKTLCQTQEVAGVYFYIGDSMLTGASGRRVGLLTASDFIEEITDESEMKVQTVTLYFAGENGNMLVAETREIHFSAVTSLERAVVEQLIAGPETAGDQPTLPEEAELVSVIVRDGIAYVNFDGSFVSESRDLPPEIIIYSLVNTLCGLPSVDRVQITVDGDSSITFRGVVSLENPLERNESFEAAQAETEPAQTETEPVQTETETESQAESGAEPATESVSESEAEAETENVTESAAEPETENVTEGWSETAAEPVTDAEAEDWAETAEETGAENRPDAGAENIVGDVEETGAESWSETAAETGAESWSETAAETGAEGWSETAAVIEPGAVSEDTAEIWTEKVPEAENGNPSEDLSEDGAESGTTGVNSLSEVLSPLG